MKPTRGRDLVALAAFAAVVTWILVRSFYGSLPPVSVFAGASLYPVALIEFVLAFVIRSRVDDRRIGTDRHQLHPITAARAVALAKASSLVGAASAATRPTHAPGVSETAARSTDRCGSRYSRKPPHTPAVAAPTSADALASAATRAAVIGCS